MEELSRVDNIKVYLAGPMRGYQSFNFKAFDEAKENLERYGYEVFSPADFDREVGFDPIKDPVLTLDDFDQQAAFDRDVEAIKKCDILVLLPGHEKSIGATAEKHIAYWLGKEVLIYPSMELYKSELNKDPLIQAYKLTTGERQNSYGPPDQDFARTAKIWSAILGIEVEARQVAMCMIGLKLSRATWSKKTDNPIDIAGYSRCLWICDGRPEK